MKFHKSTELNGSPDEVRELLWDSSVREEVALEAGSHSATVSVDEQTSGTTVVINSRQPTSGFPAAAIKFIGSELAITQEERWTSPDGGGLTVSIAGQPGKVSGRISLSERNGVTVHTVEADITVRIFLVGPKVEKVIGEILGNVLTLQAKVVNRHLAG